MRRWPIVIMAVGAVVVSSCSSDSGSTDESTAPADTAARPTRSSPPTRRRRKRRRHRRQRIDRPTPRRASTPDTIGELTDSWTGVTADSIKLGLAGVDPDEVRAFGIEFNGPVVASSCTTRGSPRPTRMAASTAATIELAFAPYLPIGDAQAEAACVALTEDEQVFAATGILLGDTSLCITETHETPYIGLFGQSAERDARAIAPFLAIEMADDRQRSAGVQAVHRRGAARRRDGRALHRGAGRQR